MKTKLLVMAKEDGKREKTKGGTFVGFPLLFFVAHSSEPLPTIIKVNYFFINISHLPLVSPRLGEPGKGS